MKSKGILVAILVVAFLVVVGGSFWFGTYYVTQSRINQMRQLSGMSPEQRREAMGEIMGGRQQQRPEQQRPISITGKVDKVTSDTITMTTHFGSQKIRFPSDVVVKKSGSGNLDDIKVGTEILVVEGERDNDGDIEAAEILVTSP